MRFRYWAVWLALGATARAELTPNQRVQEFENLVAVYAARYAPANWKIDALGVNLFDLSRWLPRVRNAKDDLEFLEISKEFVASLDDGHSAYRIASNFRASIGLSVDLYDNRPLIEFIDRRTLPVAEYPFQIGDELVSVDGRPVETLIAEFSRLEKLGNPQATRRWAAAFLFNRPQSLFPRAIELGTTARIEVRRAAGEVESYVIPWVKTGTPMFQIGAVAEGIFRSRTSEAERIPAALDNYAVSEAHREASRLPLGRTANGEEVSKSYLLSWGSRTPHYAPPPNFQIRRGLSANDVFTSGTYQSEGLRIGLIRIPNFAPAVPATVAAAQFAAEIEFFKQNTDGLVIDVTRNTGGGCVGLDYFRRIMPTRFSFFGELVLPDIFRLTSIEGTLATARAQRAQPWVIDTWEFYLKSLQDTRQSGGRLTGSLPFCTPLAEPGPLAPVEFWEPLRDGDGQPVAYDKPLIVLVDEFSVSFGDIFPAMVQDNRRGLIVGKRTAGMGGVNLGPQNVGTFSQSQSSVTGTLVTRRLNGQAPGLPAAPYIENLGVTPDVELEYMTRENLLNNGQSYVEAFTRILVGEIRRGRP